LGPRRFYGRQRAASEPTAAALDNLGIRYDPFAMLPFCGYNMAIISSTGFEMGDKTTEQSPENFLRELVPQEQRR